MWDVNSMGAWGWWVMGVCVLVFWLLVFAVGALLLRRPERTEQRDSEDILAERFARGDIDADEFARRQALIRR